MEKQKEEVKRGKPRKKNFCNTCAEDIEHGEEIKKGDDFYCSKKCVRVWLC